MRIFFRIIADQIAKYQRNSKYLRLDLFENRLIIKTHWFIIILPSFSLQWPFDVQHLLLATAVQLHSIEAEDSQCCYVTLIPGEGSGDHDFSVMVHYLGIIIICSGDTIL